MEKKPLAAAGLAGTVFLVQTGALANDPLTAKVDSIPLAAVNLTVSTSVTAYYSSVVLDPNTDASYPAPASVLPLWLTTRKKSS